jgi:hypothetical protein
LKDRLKVILTIDNGGWSMEPYVSVVQTLFNYARSQFKDLKNFYFHNTIYNYLWEDPRRHNKPYPIEELVRFDRETRFVIVGDASMAPFELMAQDGSIYFGDRSGKASIERLRFIAKTFPHAVWFNPVPAYEWQYTHTINVIREIFPMFELTIDGLGKAVAHMMRKN